MVLCGYIITLRKENRIDFMGGLGVRGWESEDLVWRKMADGTE